MYLGDGSVETVVHTAAQVSYLSVLTAQSTGTATHTETHVADQTVTVTVY